MAAELPMRRKQSARKIAEKLGVTPRTIQSIMAEPRSEFEARARARQAEAAELRSKGLTYSDIAKELGISRDAAAGLVRRANKAAQPPEPPKPPTTRKKRAPKYDRRPVDVRPLFERLRFFAYNARHDYETRQGFEAAVKLEAVRLMNETSQFEAWSDQLRERVTVEQPAGGWSERDLRQASNLAPKVADWVWVRMVENKDGAA